MYANKQAGDRESSANDVIRLSMGELILIVLWTPLPPLKWLLSQIIKDGRGRE